MISFEEFKEQAVVAIQELYPDSEVKLRKKDGETEEKIEIVYSEKSIMPNIGMNDLYQGYISSRFSSVKDMFREIMPGEKTLNGMRSVEIPPYNEAKERIVFYLINKKKNEELLKTTPYVQWLDLAIVFRYIIEFGEENPDSVTTSCLISNNILDYWEKIGYRPGLSELYKNAKQKTPKLLPPLAITPEMAAERMAEHGDLHPDADPRSVQEYCLTNTKNFYGASSILYKDAVRKISEACGNIDLVVIPSSTMEWVLFPYDGNPNMLEFFKSAIQSANEMTNPKIILSDHPYLYVRDQDKIITC